MRKHRLLLVRSAIAGMIVYIVLSRCQGEIKCCAYIAVSLLLVLELFLFLISHPAEPSGGRKTGFPQKSSTNINDCLESAINAARDLFTHKITIRRQYSDLPLIQSYPDRLIKVFFTVLENAIQTIEGIGNISVRTSKANDNVVIRISTATRNNMAVLPHERSSAAMNRVCSIVNDYGGTIEANKCPGSSIDYTIMLPVNNS